MILIDSAVCAAMKNDVRGAGYLAFNMTVGAKSWLGLKGNGWIVLAELEKMPRKTLATMVEHAGGIPGPGTAWSIMKPKKGSVQRQDVMFGMIEQEIRELLETDWDSGRELRRMPMNLDGYGLWQDRENLAVRRVHPNLESLGAWNGRAAGAGAYLAKAGTMSWCFILREPNDGTHEVWLNHLGQMSWI